MDASQMQEDVDALWAEIYRLDRLLKSIERDLKALRRRRLW